jgi:hypothetical protein
VVDAHPDLRGMTEEDWRAMARDIYDDEDHTVDEDAAVSVAEDGSGAWVACWIWVPAPEFD